MIFPARIRNIAQRMRWMESLSQKNRLSNWSGARHSRAFWDLSRAWKWLRFYSELGRIVGKTRTSERIVEMSGIARLTKSNCFSRTDACMKGSCASNKSLKNARECFAPPSHLRLESERHKFLACQLPFGWNLEFKILFWHCTRFQNSWYLNQY